MLISSEKNKNPFNVQLIDLPASSWPKDVTVSDRLLMTAFDVLVKVTGGVHAACRTAHVGPGTYYYCRQRSDAGAPIVLRQSARIRVLQTAYAKCHEMMIQASEMQAEIYAAIGGEED